MTLILLNGVMTKLKLPIEIVTKYEDIDTPVYQRVSSPIEPRVRYSVRNLWDCPEDACIGRDLVSAGEWLLVVKLGMDLARDGYDSFDIKDLTMSYDD